MVLVRKRWAGSSSHGHVWPADGAVIDVPGEDARDLCAIPDGGFAIVEPGQPAPVVTEIDEAPRPRRGRPPKAQPGDDGREIEAG